MRDELGFFLFLVLMLSFIGGMIYLGFTADSSRDIRYQDRFESIETMLGDISQTIDARCE